MNQILNPGDIVQTVESAQPCTVNMFLGGGGQGEVYSATWAGGNFALKWYYRHTATDDQRYSLERLIKSQCPSENFLWPLDLAVSRAAPGFGYIMRLRDKRFRSLQDLVRRRIDPTFAVTALAALNLVASFKKLHDQGLCYRDISFGNAFLDPNNGDVLICDNDNVSENRAKITGVMGTPDFMAPELVRMTPGCLPNRQTDLYSLAVLLFYIFFNHHPLSGKKILSIRSWDYPARKKIFGLEPLFIFDPSDNSNQAVPRALDPGGEAGANALELWPIYPQYIRDLFTKAFTTGIADPEYGRVTEGEWLAGLARLSDSVSKSCPCGSENFLDLDAVGDDGTYAKTCWRCNEKLPLPMCLKIGKAVIALNPDSHVFEHHLKDYSDHDRSSIIGQVTRHPTNPSILGLKNLSQGRWVVTKQDGTMVDVEPGKSAVLAKEIKIAIGNQVAELINR